MKALNTEAAIDAYKKDALFWQREAELNGIAYEHERDERIAAVEELEHVKTCMNALFGGTDASKAYESFLAAADELIRSRNEV